MNFVEVVPRDKAVFLTEVTDIINQFGDTVSGINVPDVLRLTNRSTDAANWLIQEGIDVIPHIRAIDQPIESHLKTFKDLHQNGLKSVLIISGDIPANPQHPVYSVSTLDLVAACKKELPALNVYVGFDPYRQSIKSELAYCQQKIQAGADGFFRNPFTISV